MDFSRGATAVEANRNPIDAYTSRNPDCAVAVRSAFPPARRRIESVGELQNNPQR